MRNKVHPHFTTNTVSPWSLSAVLWTGACLISLLRLSLLMLLALLGKLSPFPSHPHLLKLYCKGTLALETIPDLSIVQFPTSKPAVSPTGASDYLSASSVRSVDSLFAFPCLVLPTQGDFEIWKHNSRCFEILQ